MSQAILADPCSALPAHSPSVVRALWPVLAGSFAAMTGFYLLFSVVPLYAAAAGAGDAGAGLVTGTLMAATVAVELAMPALTARFGYRLLFTAGLVLLGASALLLTAGGGMAAIVAVCLLRGCGLAVVVVAGGALVAVLVPPERRGEGLALFGIAATVPALVALPLGVWLAGHVGFAPVFAAGAAVALAGLAVMPGLPGRAAAPAAAMGLLAGLRMPALVRPALVFLAVAMAAGIVTTFLPLALSSASGDLVALALLAQAVTATVARWLAGRFGDRVGQARLLVLGVATASAGIATLVLGDAAAAVLPGMLVFGAGFGVAQNASLSLMFDRVPATGYDTASALWNLAYDAGYGLGAVAFGLLAACTGYAAAFALTAALVAAALVPAWRDARQPACPVVARS
ncbi:MFS transporter [Inquilinus sp. CA228]|uniref:MFS transporter n=1 Tax=Inquilinus sp. CA228 TaxID=3455609 RepID=UPI003F8D38A8